MLMASTRTERFLYALTSWLSANRYMLLCTLILFKVVIHASNGGWYGDFWEHSAVIAELMLHPFSPQHPQLALDVPHAFYSPYSLALAFLARMFHLAAIDVLAVAGILNFLLLAYAIRVFSGTLAQTHPHITAFYALLFVLFLWGTDPWSFSGFFHFWILGDVLPYPSTCSVALSLIALSLNARDRSEIGLVRCVVIYCIAWFVLLSHPLTFVFLSIGLSIQAIFFCKKYSVSSVCRSLCGVMIGLFVVVGIAIFWPYFSIIELLTQAGNVYHIANVGVYSQIFQRTWPILILLPLTGWALHDRNGRSVLTLTCTLVCIYALAYWTQKYSFGRVIAMIALLLQVLAAEAVARIELRLCRARRFLNAVIPLCLVLLVLVFSTSWLIPSATRSMTIANSLLLGRKISNQQGYKNLTFLTGIVDRNDLVISDLQTSWLIPTFGGRVIAAQHPLAFVPDQLARQKDLETFFSEETSKQVRLDLLKKYKPKYLLLDWRGVNKWPGIATLLTDNDFGHPIYENEQYQLILLNQDLYRSN